MSENLTELTDKIISCEACHLKEGRTQVVPGIYGPKSSLCFIGEAPGYYEDKEGVPFVGRSGKLLDKMLEGINLVKQRDLSILNIIKCRPTTEEGNNRTPNEKELRFCGERWLHKQLNFLSPKMIVTLGGVALKFFSPNTSVTKTAGKMINTDSNYQIFVMYHPAYILRNYNLMEEYNSQFESIKQVLNSKLVELSLSEKEQQKTPKQKGEQKSLTDFL
ncbi:MAG: uracil-DNA glycosylase [Asgard group archaeon]|nr:uracil-DNA glycosylase [Asgard group archaeon]